MEAAVAGHLVWCCTECGAIYRSDFPRCPNDGAEVIAASRDPLVGSTVDNYVIEDLIGEGAMGRVYRAHHRHLHDRRYALKVLIGDLAVTASSRMRFEKEAESASRLNHPNVVGVFDVGRSKRGLLYIAMELVDGESAGTILDHGPMDVSRVLRIARGVCEGLAHAHAAGIVHRDLKPDNILIVDGDVPRIVDFGLAISTDRVDTRLTTTGMTMGTPAYIAPEQASGRPVDHRADLYALGVSMFEMLTQLLPFDANDPVGMVTEKVMHAAPTIEQRAPAIRVPAMVSRLVARLLAKNPDDRFATATDVLAAIDRCEAPPRSRRAGVVAMLALAAGLATVAWAFTAGTDRVATTVVSTPITTPVAVTPPVQAVVPPAPVPVAKESPPTPTTAPARVVVAKERAHRHHSHAAKADPVTIDPAPVEVDPDPVVMPPPPPPLAQPAPSFGAHVSSLDVSGSLSAAAVERALDRIAPAIAACHATSSHAAVVRFTIGESRRAESIAAPREACLAAAFAGLRTETAPDIGDVSVSVKVTFH